MAHTDKEYNELEAKYKKVLTEQNEMLRQQLQPKQEGKSESDAEQTISLNLVLSILKENYNACKTLTDEDKVRSAQEMVNETYEDLILIFEGKQRNIPAKTDSNPLAFYTPKGKTEI